jgi:hypothetical protein
MIWNKIDDVCYSPKLGRIIVEYLKERNLESKFFLCCHGSKSAVLHTHIT